MLAAISAAIVVGVSLVSISDTNATTLYDQATGRVTYVNYWKPIKVW